MKRKLSIIMVLLAFMLPYTKIFAETLTGTCGESVTYSLNTDTGLLIISGSGNMDAYRYGYTPAPWYSKRDKITKVEISDQITRIGDTSFYGCHNLASISIPNSLTSIGMGAFDECYSLKEISVPQSIKVIENGVFKLCSSLTSIDIPLGVTSIGSQAFYGCDGLTNIELPEGVTSIGYEAFRNCTSLSSIFIPNSVTSIGKDAFYQCWGLKKAEFGSIESLCNITFHNGETNPLVNAHHLYIDGEEIIDLIIPNTVKELGGYTFTGCSFIKSVKIPNSVTDLGSFAFSNCTSLSKIEFESLESVFQTRHRQFTTPYSLYIGGQEVKELIIPDFVTRIEGFANCTGLTSVIIPSTVTNITDVAFSGCSSISSVYCNATTPPVVGLGSFEGMNFNHCKIYVPIGTVNDYAFSNGWKDFYNIIEIDLSGISGSIVERNQINDSYNILGQRHTSHSGVHIQRMSNGITKKLLKSL